MSRLVVDTISDGTTDQDVDDLEGMLCRAWAATAIRDGTPLIFGSYMFTTAVDEAVGEYIYNYAAPLNTNTASSIRYQVFAFAVDANTYPVALTSRDQESPSTPGAGAVPHFKVFCDQLPSGGGASSRQDTEHQVMVFSDRDT